MCSSAPTEAFCKGKLKASKPTGSKKNGIKKVLQYLWTWLCVFLREISKNEKGKSHNSWNRATELKTFNLIALTIHYEAIWICSINDEVSSWEAKPRILETFSYSDQPQTYTFFAEDQNALSSVKALCVYLDSQNYFSQVVGNGFPIFLFSIPFFGPFSDDWSSSPLSASAWQNLYLKGHW